MRKLFEAPTRFAYELYNCLYYGLKNERGQTLVEYGLLLVLIAVVVIMAVAFVGAKTNNTYSNIGATLRTG